MIKLTAKKKYGDRVVLEVEDLVFSEGKAYALVGANGSGKSTLLKILDNQISAEGAREMDNALILAYMPQQSYAFSMSVKRNILLPVKARNKKQMLCRMHFLANMLELNGLLRKNAARLSGGETQRVALARTLMSGADVLILDEPTAAMDIEQAKGVMNLLRNEKESYGRTIVFATHSLSQAEALADEVIFLSNGKVAERGAPQDVLRNPQSEQLRAFLSFNP